MVKKVYCGNGIEVIETSPTDELEIKFEGKGTLHIRSVRTTGGTSSYICDPRVDELKKLLGPYGTVSRANAAAIAEKLCCCERMVWAFWRAFKDEPIPRKVSVSKKSKKKGGK